MDTNISRLKKVLSSIGKCEFTYYETLKDYKFNGIEVVELEGSYYTKLRDSFFEKIALQLVNKKVDEKLLKDLISLTQKYFYHVKKKKEDLRVSYLFDKSKDKLRDSSDWTHETITAYMNVQLATLNKLNSFLIKLFEEFNYLIDDDLKNLKLENDLVSDAEKNEFPEKGKVRINLTKKDTISLFLMLENIGIVDFSSTAKNKFIEQYFTYTKNNGLVLPIKDINSEISNLKDIKNYGSRNKNSYKRLNEKLVNLIESFDFNDFATKLR
jgi:hypothetical protein